MQGRWAQIRLGWTGRDLGNGHVQKEKLKFHGQAPPGLLPHCQGPAGSRAPGSGNIIAMMGTVGGMYHVSGGQREGIFYMLNMDTHGDTHTCTHTHTHRGPWQDATNCQLPILQMGTLRPTEKPPHILRLNSRARARSLLTGSPQMPCHRVWTGAEQLQGPWPHEGQMLQLREAAGHPRSHSLMPAPGAWQ